MPAISSEISLRCFANNPQFDVETHRAAAAGHRALAVHLATPAPATAFSRQPRSPSAPSTAQLFGPSSADVHRGSGQASKHRVDRPKLRGSLHALLTGR